MIQFLLFVLYIYLIVLFFQACSVNSYAKKHMYDVIVCNELMDESYDIETYFRYRDEMIAHLKKLEKHEKLLNKKNRFTEKPSVILKKLYDNETANVHSALTRMFENYKRLEHDKCRDFSGLFELDVSSFLPRLSSENKRAVAGYIASLSSYSEVVGKVEETDGMDGHAFEHWCADLLSRNGFSGVSITPGSGDQGVDITAIKEGVHYAFQCKCYSSPLGNTPVQEVFAGKEMYGCQVGVVMTNSSFTQGAISLADKTRVLLWDRDTLMKMLSSNSASMMTKP